MHSRALAVMILSGVVIAACGGGSDASREREGAAPPAAAPAQSSSLDLASLNICELMPTEFVSQTLGSPVAQAGREQDFAPVKGCEYGLRPRGGASYEFVAIWVQPPGLFQTAESILETSRGLGQEVSSEALSGLGDKAFVVNNQTEQQSEVHVLLENDLFLQVIAETRDRAVTLAEATLRRLMP